MSASLKIIRGKIKKPPRIVIYGAEGVGKSTIASEAPNPFFLQTEDGLDEIGPDRLDLITTMEQLSEQFGFLFNEPHEYKTVVLDTADWLELLIWRYLADQDGKDSIEKYDGGYGKGYTKAADVFGAVLSRFQRLRDERGMAIIILAHSKIEKVDDPESTSFDRHSPRLQKHAQARLVEWADAVLFAHVPILTITDKQKSFGKERSMALKSNDRKLRCIGSPSCVAKNRFGLPEELELSWSALSAALSESRAPSEVSNDG